MLNDGLDDGVFEGMLDEEPSAPLDAAVNSIDEVGIGDAEGLEGGGQGLGNGWYDHGIDPQPWYKPADEGVVGKGPYRRHLGPAQGILPIAPSHQAIMQQYPEKQPMQYGIAREYFEEYADVLDPKPSLEEERDYGGTMLSEEENLYRRATDGEMSTMRLPEELETRDPYGRYNELYGRGGSLVNPPTRALHGLDAHEPGHREQPLSERERKLVIAKLATRYAREQAPKLAAYFGRRRQPTSFSGLGAWELIDPTGKATRFETKPDDATIQTAIQKGWTVREIPTSIGTIGSAVNDAIKVLVPAAVGWATKTVDYKAAQPGGADALRNQYLTTTAKRETAFYEETWFWGVLAAGAAAIFVLPKVMGH